MSHKKPVRIDPLAEALPSGAVDSHAHLDMPEFDADRDAVIARAIKCGVASIGNVFLSPAQYRKADTLFSAWPQLFYLLGIHPSDGLKFDADCQAEIEAAFQADSRLRAVGEIGLDYHWDHCPREVQLEVFASQLKIAKKLERPVVIHCRDAEEDCLAFLEAGGFKDYPLLWHCFGGNARQAGRIIDNGWHISVPGSVTYPKNTDTREALNVIPATRLLLETDCPYLPPVPWRGTRNEPAYIVFTARAIAAALAMPPEELWQQSGENARKFFGLA